MTWAGRSRSRSLARPVSARTRRTSPGGNALAITPGLMWSLTRMPAGRPAGMRAIVAARPRASASMAQLCPYVNRIGASAVDLAEILKEFGHGYGIAALGLDGEGRAELLLDGVVRLVIEHRPDEGAVYLRVPLALSAATGAEQVR